MAWGANFGGNFASYAVSQATIVDPPPVVIESGFTPKQLQVPKPKSLWSKNPESVVVPTIVSLSIEEPEPFDVVPIIFNFSEQIRKVPTHTFIKEKEILHENAMRPGISLDETLDDLKNIMRVSHSDHDIPTKVSIKVDESVRGDTRIRRVREKLHKLSLYFGVRYMMDSSHT